MLCLFPYGSFSIQHIVVYRPIKSNQNNARRSQTFCHNGTIPTRAYIVELSKLSEISTWHFLRTTSYFYIFVHVILIIQYFDKRYTKEVIEIWCFQGITLYIVSAGVSAHLPLGSLMHDNVIPDRENQECTIWCMLNLWDDFLLDKIWFDFLFSLYYFLPVDFRVVSSSFFIPEKAML